MPPISRRTLVFAYIAAALGGQVLVTSSPAPGIAVLGLALAALLVERWWYPISFRDSWLGIIFLAVLGFTYKAGPVGWFFLGGLAIVTGTAIRAEILRARFHAMLRDLQRQAEESGASAQWEPPVEAQPYEEPEEEAPEEVAPPAPPQYGKAFLFGVLAMVAGSLLWFSVVLLIRWQVDVMAWGLGLLVSKAVLGGAGGRGGRPQQWMAAGFTGLGVLGARYLTMGDGEMLGLFGFLFMVVGVWTAWTHTADHGAAHGRHSA